MANLIYKSGVNLEYVNDYCEGALRAIKELVGGGKIAFFVKNNRESDEVISTLSKSNFAIHKINVPDNSLMNFSLINEVILPENTMAIVGVGGADEIESAKFHAKFYHLPLVLIPTDFSAMCALRESVEFCTKIGFVESKNDTQTVIIDRKLLFSAHNSQLGLGYILARVVDIFDGAYEGVSQRKESFTLARRVIKNVIKKLKMVNEENADNDVLALCAMLEEYVNSEHLAVGNSASFLAKLLAKTNGGNYTDYYFLAGYTLVSIYDYYLKDIPLDAVVPSDRVVKMEILSEKCGIDFSTCLSKNSALFSENYIESNYLTAEYREDFAEIISEDVFPIKQICRVYRRLEGKNPCLEGTKTVTTEMLLELISLTGEGCLGYPLIKHISVGGLLEPLMKCG